MTTMDSLPATLLCDFYKLSHRVQYPKGTEIVYSTWTPRSNKHYPSTNKVVAFGFQMFAKKYLIDFFNVNFFNRSKEEVVEEYKRVCKYCLLDNDPYTKHIEDLHDLGYLPIKIKAVAEGTEVPMKVPMLTIENTNKKFSWLTNYLETLASCELWAPSTTATIAKRYRTILDKYAMETVGNTDLVSFQGHDFSMRGLMGLDAARLVGTGHLLSFVGTDTIPAILNLEKYYNADIKNELVGTSIPATEHSVMCAGGDGEGEFETYKRLITEVYPSGFVSIVSDTWDLWNTITDILPRLKDEIMNRDGKVVIRPDSGDPVDIVCGRASGATSKFDAKTYDKTPAGKGVVELLWDIFGGIVNEKGYKELDEHIGCIYGDSITPERCEEICKRLEAKGFASTNMVYGIGSYTYQYNTRDTFGFAMKATLCVIDSKEKFIYKDPVTDDGTKKSLTGAVVVVKNNSRGLVVSDKHSIIAADSFQYNELRTIFEDGKLIVNDTLADIRARVASA